MKLLLTCFLVSGCGAEPHIESSLKPLLDHYLEVAGRRGELDKLESLQFGSVLDQGERGVCNIEKKTLIGKAYNETRSVVIDPMGEFGNPVALTVFHELGHCLGNLRHTTGSYDIMNPMRVADPDYWTPEHIEEALTAMLKGDKR